MDRPGSPTSIMNFAHEVQEENENSISITGFREAARIGFDHVKQKLNKTSITSGDALNELFNFNVHDPATDNELLVPIFCLSIFLLRRSKEALDAISPGAYNSLVNYAVNQFEIKSQ